MNKFDNDPEWRRFDREIRIMRQPAANLAAQSI
jgi:hypothetical protein